LKFQDNTDKFLFLYGLPTKIESGPSAQSMAICQSFNCVCLAIVLIVTIVTTLLFLHLV